VNNFENEKGDIADIMCKVTVEAACDYTIKIHNRRHPAVEKKLANRYKLIILLLQLERSDKFCLCANGPKVFWGFFLGGGRPQESEQVDWQNLILSEDRTRTHPKILSFETQFS